MTGQDERHLVLCKAIEEADRGVESVSLLRRPGCCAINASGDDTMDASMNWSVRQITPYAT
ncbi:hypothetical protein [Streptomyces flaveolus]|uniref:hypothetical protein n=1 Tax=Streptomyces flaveolus TaxID=67297 RepID=UPI0036F7B102